METSDKGKLFPRERKMTAAEKSRKIQIIHSIKACLLERQSRSGEKSKIEVRIKEGSYFFSTESLDGKPMTRFRNVDVI